MNGSVDIEIARRQDNRAVRWYVLTLPSCHKGPAKGLYEERERRVRNGEPLFDFFAPTYYEVREKGGKLERTNRPLMFNYVFVRASERLIYDIKRTLPMFNFLPKVRQGSREYYPYLSDELMENLRWVAKSYSDEVPVYTVSPDRLVIGDRVKIIDGPFKGSKATVVKVRGSKRKDVVVKVEDYMMVPLMRIEEGEYEIIGLGGDDKKVYSRLNNDKFLDTLHETLHRHYLGTITQSDLDLAQETLRQYAGLQMETANMRCRQYSILLPAYKILGDTTNYEKTVGIIRNLLQLVSAPQSRALLLVTLYGCTDNSVYYSQAHEIVAPWRDEEAPKKFKQQLIARLDDYDRWFGH